ncbi:hypothetical protein CRE_21195 [Caenorhabditis remanei]|uniref:Sulfotransferase domain-containing protein n=1 Tax=Caenorhabditis remanei TaxID=31234 RepID=E3MET1_CAERE|nr:hypothetical protein CRE_21195 [Caenorhabditis remanei]
MNEKILLRLFTYLIFRFLHLLFLLESDIYALVLRLFDKKNNGDDEVEVFNIFARHRFDCTDVTRESDFLSFHEKSTLFEEICEEGWFIYSITDRYVYFVKITPIEEDVFETTISIEKCSKLSNFLYQNAEKLARCQLDTFQRITKNMPPSRSKVLIFHSPPSSGGTTVGKLLQSCDESKLSLLVIGEPPFLTSLSLLFNKLSVEELRSLCKSTLRFSTMHQKSQQTIVFKSKSSCTKIVPFIHSAVPSIQHFFVTRKNTNDIISRLILKTSSEFNFPMFSFLLKFGQHLDMGWLSSWKELENETFTRVGPKNELEFAMAQVYGSIMNYKRNRQYFVQDVLFVEDLISDTATMIRPLLDLCEISDLAIPECIEWKRNADEQIQQVWDTVDLPSEDVARVGCLAELLEQDVFFF